MINMNSVWYNVREFGSAFCATWFKKSAAVPSLLIFYCCRSSKTQTRHARRMYRRSSDPDNFCLENSPSPATDSSSCWSKNLTDKDWLTKFSNLYSTSWENLAVSSITNAFASFLLKFEESFWINESVLTCNITSPILLLFKCFKKVRTLQNHNEVI